LSQHGRIGLAVRPADSREEVWYFAYGTNMHDSVFRQWRGMRPLDWRPGRVRGYRLRFNLEGHPRGKAAPANVFPDQRAEVWGVLYKLTRRDLIRLDATEGIPWSWYRQLWLGAEDIDGNPLRAMTYIVQGKESDGIASRRRVVRATSVYVIIVTTPCRWGYRKGVGNHKVADMADNRHFLDLRGGGELR
jgi:hypothetical protein